MQCLGHYQQCRTQIIPVTQSRTKEYLPSSNPISVTVQQMVSHRARSTRRRGTFLEV